jgi:hypothetical protein
MSAVHMNEFFPTVGGSGAADVSSPLETLFSILIQEMGADGVAVHAPVISLRGDKETDARSAHRPQPKETEPAVASYIGSLAAAAVATNPLPPPAPVVADSRQGVIAAAHTLSGGAAARRAVDLPLQVLPHANSSTVAPDAKTERWFAPSAEPPSHAKPANFPAEQTAVADATPEVEVHRAGKVPASARFDAKEFCAQETRTSDKANDFATPLSASALDFKQQPPLSDGISGIPLDTYARFTVADDNAATPPGAPKSSPPAATEPRSDVFHIAPSSLDSWNAKLRNVQSPDRTEAKQDRLRPGNSKNFHRSVTRAQEAGDGQLPGNPLKHEVAHKAERPKPSLPRDAGKISRTASDLPDIAAPDTAGELATATSGDPTADAKAAQARPAAILDSANIEASLNRETADRRIPAAPIQVTPLLQRMEHSAIRLGVRTPAFGSVEIRTSLRGNYLGMALSAEKGDLKTFMSPEVSTLQDTLRRHHLHFEELRFLETQSVFLDARSDADPNSHPQHQAFASSGQAAHIPKIGADKEEEAMTGREKNLSLHV